MRNTRTNWQRALVISGAAAAASLALPAAAIAADARELVVEPGAVASVGGTGCPPDERYTTRVLVFVHPNSVTDRLTEVQRLPAQSDGSWSTMVTAFDEPATDHYLVRAVCADFGPVEGERRVVDFDRIIVRVNRPAPSTTTTATTTTTTPGGSTTTTSSPSEPPPGRSPTTAPSTSGPPPATAVPATPRFTG
jgi:hypothetical protein